MPHTQPAPARAADTSVQIRPFTRADGPAVAALFVAAMREGRGQANPALADYLVSHFLEGPFADRETPARAAIAPDGTLVGFAGATRHALEIAGARKSVVVGSTLMVRDHARDPMTGARLLRALLEGPQDATVSETASEPSLPMWDKLGGQALPEHSLDFVRVLRPAAYALAQARRRTSILGLAAPLVRPLDAWANGRRPIPTWTSLPAGFTARGGARARPITLDALRAHAADWLARAEAKPLYSDDDLAHILADTCAKSDFGPPQMREIALPSGKALGAALYHLAPGGNARLHTLMAPPAHVGIALDAILADARDAGAVALTGRCDPVLFEPLSRRRALFARESTTVIHTRDADLARAVRDGTLAFNGLFGERWTRLIGDSALWSEHAAKFS